MSRVHRRSHGVPDPQSALRCSLHVPLLLVLGATAAAAQQAPLGYDAALARYKECLERVPFQHHTEGRQTLAATAAPEALDVLIADYKGCKEYPEYSRYALADLFGRYFDDPACVDRLRSLRLGNKKPGDAWLWVNSLKVEANRGHDDDALKIAREDKSALLRAAAIAGLGMAHNSLVFDAMFEAATTFPRKESDRYLLLGAMTGAIYDNKGRVRSDKARAGMTAYIQLLAEPVKMPHTAKVQMARVLQWALDGPGLMVTPEPWLLLLEQGGKKQSAAAGNTAVQPRFFGIETEGERFCYVLDMSDSMCRRIDPSVKPPGPVTGPKMRPKGELLDESDLPWHAINSRFDLMREHLKISLQRLPDDKFFSLVLFGTEAMTLKSCPGLIPATRGNVAKVIKELDGIVPGPPDPAKAPDGQLFGNTNMHGGLRRAFALSGKGFVEEYAYVDAGPLTEGCDTIFLLSDGAPSWDDFAADDKDYGEGEAVVDTEYGKAGVRTPRMHYHGPFVWQPNLLADVERMNAFRRVRLHCIGIGEANEQLLRRLADIGHGDVYIVGRGGNSEIRGGAK